MKVYITGPMTGYSNYNFDAFYEAEIDLTYLGYEVINPATISKNLAKYTGRKLSEISKEEYLRHDKNAIDKCDALYLLKGWENSEGAREEVEYAKSRGKLIMYPKDQEKLEWHLLPIRATEEVVKVLTKNKKKHGEYGWKEIKPFFKHHFNAAMRHLTDWRKGKKKDDDTGCHVLAHCVNRLLFIIEKELE